MDELQRYARRHQAKRAARRAAAEQKELGFGRDELLRRTRKYARRNLGRLQFS